jgi:predicted acyl esterase
VNLIIEKNLKAVLRDGTTLLADVYRPHTHDKVPVVLMRLAYSKELPAPLFLAGDILRVNSRLVLSETAPSRASSLRCAARAELDQERRYGRSQGIQ